jgi:hypothetical protein
MNGFQEFFSDLPEMYTMTMSWLRISLFRSLGQRPARHYCGVRPGPAGAPPDECYLDIKITKESNTG